MTTNQPDWAANGSAATINPPQSQGQLSFNESDSQLKDHDIDRANRENFRSCLQALSRPGEIQRIIPVFDSGLLAMSSVLLYAEVTYYCDDTLNFDLIHAICGSEKTEKTRADYLFFHNPESNHLIDAKVGTAESPEFGATLVFGCKEFKQTDDRSSTAVVLSGPGIKDSRQLHLPADRKFIETLRSKNSFFPMGIDLFFVSTDHKLLGIPRTTNIEVLK